MDVDTFLVSLIRLKQINQQKTILKLEEDARRRWRTYLRRRRFVSMLFVKSLTRPFFASCTGAENMDKTESQNVLGGNLSRMGRQRLEGKLQNVKRGFRVFV